MKKDGFAFLESIAVLVVVAISIAMLIASYTLISSRAKGKENFDKASDKYLLYAISNLINSEECTYAKECTLNGRTYGIDMAASVDTCASEKTGQLMFNCGEVFKKFNIKNLYVLHDINSTLDININDPNIIRAERLSNGTIEYIKTLKKCSDKDCVNPITYLIGEFDRGDMYYAAIVINSID